MIDWTKPIQTRDGKPARLICSDAKRRGHSHVVLITDKNDIETVSYHYTDGSINPEKPSPHDIINVPAKHKGWVNIYRNCYVSCGSSEYRQSFVFADRRDADRNAGTGRIACIEIEFAEGEGLKSW